MDLSEEMQKTMLGALTEETITIESLDHLGLIAGTMDTIGLIPIIDKMLPINSRKGSKVSMGNRVGAMILNGLGFVNRRLYMFPDFLKNKPVEKLFGEDIKAEYFNDDALGRCLDRIYDYGVMKMFSEIAMEIGTKFHLIGKGIHFDTTSLSVYGEYDYSDNKDNEIINDKALDSHPNNNLNNVEANVCATPVLEEKIVLASPEFGYAKNKRMDLKQMVLLLATTGKAGFPIWMEAQSGNVSDKVSLHQGAERMSNFYEALKKSPNLLFVADSAAYDACVSNEQRFLWLSRVPETHSLAKEMLSKKDGDIVWTQLDDGYKQYVETVDYKNVTQRWALIYSEQAFAKETKTLEKNIEKEKKSLDKAISKFCKHVFGCQKDGLDELEQLKRKMKYHEVESYSCHEVLKYKGKGRPSSGSEKHLEGVSFTVKLIRDEEKIEVKSRQKGRFILSTNQLDIKALRDDEILSEYKEQSKTESGFRFIKDNSFEISSIYLKKPERINALMMVMTLCLMIYNLSQHNLREALKQANETIPNQVKKEIQNPTMVMLCKMFEGVGVVVIDMGDKIKKIVANITPILRRIIGYFGAKACRIYDVKLCTG
jgi:transposase